MEASGMDEANSEKVPLKDKQFNKFPRQASEDEAFSEGIDAVLHVEKKSQVSTHWPMILSCLAAASFHFPLGTIIGYSAILFPQLQASDSEIKITKEDMSWLASLYPLMVPLGSALTAYLVDRIGRINTLKVGALPYIVGWVCIATAVNIEMLLIGRILGGITSAMVSSPVFIYIPETAVPELRGFLLGMAPAICALGMILVYTKGAFLYWRTVAWVSAAYCVVPLLLMHFWSSESPPWLVARGRNQDALQSLDFLSRNRQSEPGMVDKQLEELVKEHELKKSTNPETNSSMKTLLQGLLKPNGYKPFLLLVMIFTFQQFSGIYITIFYGVTLFQAVGTTIDPYLSTVGIGLIRLVFGFVVSLLMKSFGRRPLFIVSSLGMAVFMFIAGYITKQVAAGEMESNMIPGVCIWVYMILGVVGLVTLPWTMTGEMFAIEIRGMAQAAIYSLAHVLMFVALKIFPFLPGLLGGIHSVLWFFATVSLCAAGFIYIFFPETHKKTLAEIQDYFKHNTVYILSRNKPLVMKKLEDVKEELTV